MTNHWIDIANSDCILCMGSNPAENHPISFKWITRAMEDKGAMLISVDPRFTRTSAKADFYTALRSGTDVAFLGGMIKYILDNNLSFKEYVVEYTNAPFILDDKYSFNDGLFSGYDPNKRAYDKSFWAFKKNAEGIPEKDRTLENPRCVFQQLKMHYSRYDVETVSKITGTPVEDLKKVYGMYASTGKPDKAGTVLYAMGWTQHTIGVQNIRTMCIVQLLLGNMGIAGGGVNALRGESNVQGSTDHGLLFNVWPGYLKVPTGAEDSLEAYHKKNTPTTSDPLSANWWQNYPKYSVSFLKSMFGEKATKENDFGYGWLPKLDSGKSYSWLDIFDVMYRGEFKGLFAWGQNPACSGANSNKTRQALGKLEWLVNVNLFHNETGSFWMGPGMDPHKIKTEVFLLPCASSVEKEGSISNSGRWMQWRYQAAKPLLDTKPDAEIMVELMEQIKELYRQDKNAVFAEPILNSKWDYTTDGKFDPHKVAKEINGYFLTDVTIKGETFKKGTLVPGFASLQADGSTSSGCWIYCNSYTEKGNMAARRNNTDKSGIGLYSEWAWCWPMNRRIIYNRASVDLKGQPWDKKHPVIRFVGEVTNGKYTTNKWEGDVPDGAFYPMKNPDGSNRSDSKYPFIMKPDGCASLFGPGTADGPFPEHYEPLECPVEKNIMSSQRINPVLGLFKTQMDSYLTCDPRFPFVGTTYRVTEHWQTGVMTRWLPWLLEAEPQQFCEISEELAQLKEFKNGDSITVSSARGKIKAVAIVTTRLKPFKIGDVVVHQVGLPWCFGWITPKNGGDSSNLLTSSVGDPNTKIPEVKAFMVNVEKAQKEVIKDAG
jgi:formate dehydrogenase major subunit